MQVFRKHLVNPDKPLGLANTLRKVCEVWWKGIGKRQLGLIEKRKDNPDSDKNNMAFVFDLRGRSLLQGIRLFA